MAWATSDALLSALEREPFSEEVAQRLTSHVVLAELRTGKLPKDQADQLLRTLLLEQHFVCNSDLRPGDGVATTDGTWRLQIRAGKGGGGYASRLYKSAKARLADMTPAVSNPAEKLERLWASGKMEHIIEPCERWVAEQGQLSKQERVRAIPKAKSEFCSWNAAAGFLSGALPIPVVDVAAGVAAGFYLQAQGACVVAKLRGYDVRDNATQSMILWSLTGEGFSELLKSVSGTVAAKGGEKMGQVALKQLPNKAIQSINSKLWPLIGRRVLTKQGKTGLLQLGKFVPVVGQAIGAVAGSAVDWYFCHKAIDFADQHVFNLIIREQEALRNFLEQNDFEDLVESLVVKGGLDLETICQAEKKDLTDLGVPLGRALKLLKSLFKAGGNCVPSKQEL
eukprot:Skav215016  [mRNA]  locus=scaffold966:90497:93969:+ [translate_table: standard]